MSGDATGSELTTDERGTDPAGPETTINRETPLRALDERRTLPADLFVRNNGLWPSAASGGREQDISLSRLEIGGLVDRPVSLSVEQLRTSFDSASVSAVLECAGNGRAGLVPPTAGLQWTIGAVGCSTYRGVRVRDLLAAVGVHEQAVYLGFHSPDRGPAGEVAISRGLPIWKALAPETLVAFEMGGGPLPFDHGGPLRIVAPGFPGAAWQKWLTRIEVLDHEHDGPRMTGTDYRLPDPLLAPGEPIEGSTFKVIEDMPIRSLISHPPAGSEVARGATIEIRGWAWSGAVPVASVEVSADGGATWRDVPLESGDGPWDWRRFRLQWTAPTGSSAVLVARATNEAGISQPLDQAWNPRGYCNNACQRVEVAIR